MYDCSRVLFNKFFFFICAPQTASTKRWCELTAVVGIHFVSDAWQGTRHWRNTLVFGFVIKFW